MIDLRFRPLDRWIGKQTPEKDRRRSPFRAKYAATLDQLERELAHLNARNVVIEAGFKLEEIRNDGWPRSSARPSSPAIILSFQQGSGAVVSMPCDTYQTWEDNLRAIALSLEALRAVDRYGVTRGGEQYAGFKQLPAASEKDPIQAAAERISNLAYGEPRYAGEILDSPARATAAYKSAARIVHPDRTGNRAQWDQLEKAYSELKAYFESRGQL